MPRNRRQIARTIHVELTRIAGQNPPFDHVSRSELVDGIAKHGGSSSRTIDSYIKELKRIDAISEITDDKYRIHDLEEFNANPTKERMQKYVTIGKDIKQKAERLNVNMSALLEMALVDWFGSLEDFIAKAASAYVSSRQEAEYIKGLVIHDLYRQSASDEACSALYESVFNKESLDKNDFERIDELRETAFDVAEGIGIESW